MPFSKSRLFLTSDIYDENVWFVRTEVERFARLYLTDKLKVRIWFYKYKYKRETETFDEALKLVEKTFVRYYYEKYYK